MNTDEPGFAEQRCGCYSCERLFTFQEITDWWDEGTTPVCPFCGSDSVVMERPDMLVTPDRLHAMRSEKF